MFAVPILKGVPAGNWLSMVQVHVVPFQSMSTKKGGEEGERGKERGGRERVVGRERESERAFEALSPLWCRNSGRAPLF